MIYTTTHCGDCRTAKSYFKQKNIPYLEINIEQDDKAAGFVKDLNRGFASVPTIIFPDGSILVEPDIQELNAKFSKP